MTFEELMAGARELPLLKQYMLRSVMIVLKRDVQIVAHDARTARVARDRRFNTRAQKQELLTGLLLHAARNALELRVPEGTLVATVVSWRPGEGAMFLRTRSEELEERLIKFEAVTGATSDPDRARHLSVALFSSVIRVLEAHNFAFSDLRVPEQASA